MKGVVTSFDPQEEEFARKVSISKECLLEHGLIPIRRLACGISACTYYVCKISDSNEQECNIVIKVGHISEREVQITRIASDLGVGPLLIDYFTCNNMEHYDKEGDSTKDRDYDEKVNVLVLQRLDVTLEDLKITEDNLDKFKELIEKTVESGLYHGDIHEANIMATLNSAGEVEEFKLIDFGFAKIDADPLDLIDLWRKALDVLDEVSVIANKGVLMDLENFLDVLETQYSTQL